MFGGLLVLDALDLVRQGRLNGNEMAVLAFDFSLDAFYQPLCCIGRPLEGLDKWSPAAQVNESDQPEAPAATNKIGQLRKRPEWARNAEGGLIRPTAEAY